MAVGAMELMIHPAFSQHSSRVVVEGAPGQGKSTVTQFLCQVHRLVLLGKDFEYSKVPQEHRPRGIRIPFRVDLRDYATWLSGRNPFEETPTPLAPGTPKVLETFIAAQVNAHTGATFSADDLLAVARKSQLLIVLDGFDEVAEPKLRNLIVEQVSSASVRLDGNSISCQIIVTSRPAVFANSPGFSKSDWQYLEIMSLTRGVIDKYAQRWLQGRNADLKERQLILSVLSEKLEQPHVRDLARNPMQLAILLALIAVQGASLPHKRTSLYDNYVEIFLNRESEKSEIVRNHRDLLVQIHRFLAWKLHSEAEESEAGNIGEAQLKDALRKYLMENEHPADLVDQLFTGMVERVVALVSRVQGTFEFEVQPLREYFAARYLYDTAPYAPPGQPRSGTLPERFDALAKNFYWLNVTRFYAGCYSSGELASLVHGLEELKESKTFKYLAYTAQLAVTLLGDYVFNQQPKLAGKLTASIVQAPAMMSFIGEDRARYSSDTLKLPGTSSRSVLINFAKGLLNSPNNDLVGAASRILNVNCDDSERIAIWTELKSVASLQQWVRIGLLLQCWQRISVADALVIEPELGSRAPEIFGKAGRYDVFDAKPELWPAHFKELLDVGFVQMPNSAYGKHPSRLGDFVEKVSWLLWPFCINEMAHGNPKTDVRSKIKRYFYSNQSDGLQRFPDRLADASFGALEEAADAILDSSSRDLLSNFSLWASFIEACREICGDQFGLYVSTSSFLNFIEIEAEPAAICDVDSQIQNRLAFAKRNAHDHDWWRTQITEASKEGGCFPQVVLLCMSRWAGVETILALSSHLTVLVEMITPKEWGALVAAVGMGPYKGRDASKKVGVEAQALPSELSPRLASLIFHDVNVKTQKRLWERYFKNYLGEDADIQGIRAQMAIDYASSSSHKWKECLAIVCDAHKRAHIYLSPSDMGSRHSRMPIDIAEIVCRDSLVYPLGLVGYASSVLTSQAGSEAVPVGRVAEKDDWFA